MPEEFSKEEIKRPAPIHESTNPVAMEMSNLGRRVRSLEEHYCNLLKKISITDSNMLANNKKLMLEVKTMNAEMTELKRDMAEIKDRFMLLIKELQSCAKREEVKVIERYMNLWEPLNFVTRNQVERIVKEILEGR